MAHLKGPALVLDCYDYSESSQIAHLLTRDYGKVRVIAKGIKKQRTFGVFDHFVFGDVVLLRKKKNADQLAILIELSIRSNFHGIRRRLDHIYAAFLALELANSSAQEDHGDREMFDLVLRFLTWLDRKENGPLLPAVVMFCTHFLRAAGLLPRFDRCLECERPLENLRGTVFFSPGSGGFTCRNCPHPPGWGFPVPRETLLALQRITEAEEIKGSRDGSSRDALPGMRRVLFASLESMIDRKLRSAPFLARLDPQSAS